MANLPENAYWETGIYQLETTDPVMGGADGIDNFQAKQLANRTVWLKQQLELGAGGQAAGIVLLTKADAQSLTAGVISTIAMTMVRRNEAGVTASGSSWVVPAGYSYVRVSGSCAIDPPDGVDFLYAVTPLINGAHLSTFATANGSNSSPLTAGTGIIGNFISPYIPVNAGDTLALGVYAGAGATTVANQVWLQFELINV